MTREEVWCGYELDTSDPDQLELIAPNGNKVGGFYAIDATLEEVREAAVEYAIEHAAEVDRSAGHLARLLENRRPSCPAIGRER